MASTEEPATAAVAVGCKIAPRSYERRGRAPAITRWEIRVYLVRWVGRRSTPAHDIHEGRGLRECPRERSCLACWSWYIGDRHDGIRYRIIVKRVAGIDKRSAVPVTSTAGVNEIAAVVEIVDRHSRYIAACEGQHGVLHHPHVGRGSKFPNRVGHSRVNLKAAQNVELVVKDSEAAGQSYPVGVPGPRRSDALDGIRDGVVAENAVCRRNLAAC